LAKKTDVFYSLLNLVSAQTLSGQLKQAYTWNMKPGETFSRRRNWNITQFYLGGTDILEYFINGVSLDTSYSLGSTEIWVKEEDIDQLYAVLAFSVMTSLCNYAKQSSLVGAFLFQKDPQLFLDEDFTNKHNSLFTMIIQLKLGKEFIEFLESFGVLKFTEASYIRHSGQYKQKQDRKTYSFSTAEFELIKRERKDIQTMFTYTKK
jgi:hypothetical protein